MGKFPREELLEAFQNYRRVKRTPLFGPLSAIAKVNLASLFLG